MKKSFKIIIGGLIVILILIVLSTFALTPKDFKLAETVSNHRDLEAQ